MRRVPALVAIVLLLSAHPALAGGQDRLARQIMALGAWDMPTSRNAIILKGCKMQVLFYKDWDARPKVLHSVHHIDMADWWPLADRPRKQRDGYFSMDDLRGGKTEVAMLDMRPPAMLTSELALRSDPSPPYKVIRRQGIGKFAVKRRHFHGLRFDRLPVSERGRGRKLVRLLDRYHSDYCRVGV